MAAPGQPQGGFITRKPTADVRVASDNDDGFGFGSFFQRNWGPQPVDPPRGGGQFYRPVQRGWW